MMAMTAVASMETPLGRIVVLETGRQTLKARGRKRVMGMM